MVEAVNHEAARSADTDARFELFTRLWGVALLAHVIGNWAQPDIPSIVGFANLLVGLVGLLLTIRPRTDLLLVGAAFTCISLLAEMPFTGNHWFLAGLVSVALLLSRGGPDYLFPSARLILLVFYVFAAFAKLNPAFFDPAVSCSLFYANQALENAALPTIDPASFWSRIPIWGSAIVEICVPVLLLIRRSRYLGVTLASVFHLLISFDLGQHFYDFTAVMLPLFMLFLPAHSSAHLLDQLRKWRPSRALARALTLVIAGLVLLSVAPPTAVSAALLNSIPFLLWIPFGLTWVYGLWVSRRPGQRLTWRPGIAAIAVGLAGLNGLTPYTEVKTAYGFNMYANLVTARGESNHFLIRNTVPLRKGYEDPVEIISSSDPGLEQYRQLGYLIAYPQLRRYLASHPEVSLTFRQNGRTISLDRAADLPELVDPGPWWWRFFPLRAIDQRIPPRCQDVFLAAL
jgi:hypothetical protein